jgi:two-component system sensor histidine kinase EvgS
MVPVALTISPLYKQEDEYIGLVLTIYDRTEEVKLLSAKDAFIGTVAHELNTPIVALTGTVEILKKELTGINRPLAERLESISNHMAQRIKEIIKISELLADDSQPLLTVQSVSAIMDEIKTKFEQKINDKGLTLHILTDAPTLKIKIEPTYKQQLFDIILDNAIQYTQKGAITITVYEETINVQPMVTFDVTDTGIGIDRETQKHLFEPFIQEGGPLERDQIKGGLGLGLYLAKLFIEKMSGSIRLQSQPGGGTTVSISFLRA